MRGSNFRTTSERECCRVLVPDFGHQLVRGPHAEVQSSFANLHNGLYANCFPILGDELRHVGPGTEGRHDADLYDRGLAILHQSNALWVMLGQPQGIEHLIRFVAIELGVFRGPFLPWEIRVPRRGDRLASLAKAEKH